MRVAVVGGGVSGLTAAYLLAQRHDVILFEASRRLGGHTWTASASSDGITHAVDMGFIVFNERNYPGFMKLLERLGVASRRSNMSFGVSCETTGLEYRASSLSSFFAQRRNLANPAVYRMILDIFRFKRHARRLLDGPDTSDVTLLDYLRRGRYSRSFIEHFIVPMGAAIWSADIDSMTSFPARYLMQFFDNHRFLDAGPQSSWRTVEGGSSAYVERLEQILGARVRRGSPVRAIRRHESAVDVATSETSESFDHVIICTHSDQALRLLERPSDAEHEVLGSIPYRRNDTVLHTDTAVMPRERRAWASWNVRLPAVATPGVNVTYHSNLLQGLNASSDFLVTLNRTSEIRDDRVIERVEFEHPVYSFGALAAQKRRDEISGVNRTSYAGAYWGFGFHEDGVQSAIAATRAFGVEL